MLVALHKQPRVVHELLLGLRLAKQPLTESRGVLPPVATPLHLLVLGLLVRQHDRGGLPVVLEKRGERVQLHEDFGRFHRAGLVLCEGSSLR